MTRFFHYIQRPRTQNVKCHRKLIILADLDTAARTVKVLKFLQASSFTFLHNTT